jgi:phosphoglycolate phosphatase-like HAD superfamily hydrolase
MALQALLWDVDGTLAETERDGHRLAFNRAFADVGVPLHWDAARYGELLANVDSLHGGAESLLTISNLLVVLGFSGIGAVITAQPPRS